MSGHPKTFWLIVRPRVSVTDGIEVTEAWRSTLAAGKKALVVFSLESEAGTFLGEALRGNADDTDDAEEVESGWALREVGAGELVSLLHCLYAGTERVVLDPSPPELAELAELAELYGLDGWSEAQSLDREAFVRLALERGSGLPATYGCEPPSTGQTVKTGKPETTSPFCSDSGKGRVRSASRYKPRDGKPVRPR
ncbi:hypothetical protein [Rubrobacter aplysinae]|uniref:hypothetical protein n=1 Tax=Rubrobacter aplysinae TaxID=909625 RepID=UPI00128E015E|nr:hypothetical protein [Rubrobacter aplysinae]